MADNLTQQQRSKTMSSVKNKNTAAEIKVRSLLHSMGYRYRLHRKDLPGTPDIVLPSYRKVIFVHGCFWHGHNCPKGKRPETRKEFWAQKLDRNIERDNVSQQELKDLGWEQLVVWECETKDKNVEALRNKLSDFLSKPM